MYSNYKMNINELNEEFLISLKTLFKDKNIEIIVHEIEDETEYLLRSENNRKHLLDSINNIKNKKDLVSLEIEDLT